MLSTMSDRVLVVDDDAPVRRMLARTLEADGHEVTTVADGGRALAEVERSTPDVVILDVAMPGMDGLAVCRRLREKGLAAPILLLTAHDSVADRVMGLDAGADDYLVKPFAVPELTARLRALARRGQAPTLQLAAADLTLDVSRRAVRRDGREIELTERECALLELLMRHPRAVVSREMAIEEVWDTGVSENVVDTYIGYLRRKLGEPPVIHTVRGVGFTLRR